MNDTANLEYFKNYYASFFEIELKDYKNDLKKIVINELALDFINK